MGLQQFDERIAVNAAAIIDSTIGTAPVNLWVGGLEAVRFDSLTVTNDDTIPHILRLALLPGLYTPGLLVAVLVPAGAGLGTVPLFDLGAALGAALPVLILREYDGATVAVDVAVTVLKYVTVTARGGLI